MELRGWGAYTDEGVGFAGIVEDRNEFARGIDADAACLVELLELLRGDW